MNSLKIRGIYILSQLFIQKNVHIYVSLIAIVRLESNSVLEISRFAYEYFNR